MDELGSGQNYVLHQQLRAQPQSLRRARQGLEQRPVVAKQNAAAMAASRASQTEEERAAAAARSATTMVASRASLTEAGRAAVAVRSATAMAASRASLTEEQRAAAAARNATSMAASRASLTEEQRAAAAARNAATMVASWASLTEEQRAAAAARNASAMTASRARHIEEQRAVAATRSAVTMAASRASQTAEVEQHTTVVVAAPRMARRANFLDVARQTDVAESDARHQGLTYDPTPGRQTIGRMEMKCQHCGAFHWLGESVADGLHNPRFRMCCNNGKVQLPPLQTIPPPLDKLLQGDTEDSRHFLKNSRGYNNALQLASTGAQVDNIFPGRNALSNFRIQGGVYQRMGPLLPDEGEGPKFAQLYVYDTEHELGNRLLYMSGLRPDILSELQTMLHRHNPYVHEFKRVVASGHLQLVLRADMGVYGGLLCQSRATTIKLFAQQPGSIAGRPVSRIKRRIRTPRSRQSLRWALHYPASHSFGFSKANAPILPDAMAIVRTMGKPQYFLTMTCNPKWLEITAELLPGQTAADRPNLVARVFNLKLGALLVDLFKRGVLGTVVAAIHVIEFQKRGLPHCHLLLIVASDSIPRGPQDYDRVVCAEIPDPITQPLLFETVANCMMHGPCGALNPSAPCMKDGRCTKGYPKSFHVETIDTEEGYPVYRRRDNGRVIQKGRGGDIELDNRWVVPYNPWLGRRYNCHMNVKITVSVAAVKYLFKYVYKGHDRAQVAIQIIGAGHGAAQAPQQALDEIGQYLDARYVSASEACWRLFSFEMHARFPAVYRLAVHMSGEQMVVFNAQSAPEVVAHQNSTTTLTGWMQMNCDCPPAREHLYVDFPTHFTWNKTTKRWAPRKRGPTPIGRMYLTHPGEGERHYLRLLLHHIKGATSFEALRTIDGHLFSSYKAITIYLGLLEDDAEHDACLEEAASVRTGAALRQLFATILVFGVPKDPVVLWEKHLGVLTDDLLHRACQNVGIPHLAMCPLVVNEALLDVQKHLQDHGKTLADFAPMPLPIPTASGIGQVSLMEVEELAYDAHAITTQLAANLRQLNSEQQAVYNVVLKALYQTADTASSRLFFVDGLGGTGKTFLYNTLLARVRSEGGIALAVASSGIAALLLHGGCTAHSRFKIPFDCHETSTCALPIRSDGARLLQKATLIVWDEAPMAHKHNFGAVDRSMRDLMGALDPALEHVPFGGKVFVFGGDFRQILPVVKRGDRGAIVRATFNCSPLWSSIRFMRLTSNMRVRRLQGAATEQQQAFVEYLQAVGEGRVPTERELGEDVIRMPDNMSCPTENLLDLIDYIYGVDANCLIDKDFIVGRAILMPKNFDVDLINETVMRRFPGQERVYLSADSLENENQQALYPTEFLNSLLPFGIPPHRLALKVGAPIMLLRNMNDARGQANGTRLICRGFSHNVLDAEIVTGNNMGARIFIPRITLAASDADIPFHLKRRQFPIRPAFGMTINKSQGQTMDFLGLYLPNLYSHMGNSMWPCPEWERLTESRSWQRVVILLAAMGCTPKMWSTKKYFDRPGNGFTWHN